MKELYNHFNRTGYSKINWCTNLDVINARRKVFDEIKTVEEKPNPNRRCANYPLRTFAYKDFRLLKRSAPARGTVVTCTTHPPVNWLRPTLTSTTLTHSCVGSTTSVDWLGWATTPCNQTIGYAQHS